SDGGPSARPASPGGIRRDDQHRARRRAQYLARVLVRDHADRLVRREPDAFRDPFFELRPRLARDRFDEVEVAVLVDESTAVAEVPIDRRQLALRAQLVQPGLLLDLAQ